MVTNARAIYSTRAAAGATGTRCFLRPLFSRGKKFLHNSGASAPREGGSMHLAGMCASPPLRRQGPITPGGYLAVQRSNKDIDARNNDDTAYGSLLSQGRPAAFARNLSKAETSIAALSMTDHTFSFSGPKIHRIRFR